MNKDLITKQNTKFEYQVIPDTFISGDGKSTVDFTEQWNIRLDFNVIEKLEHSRSFINKKFEMILEGHLVYNEESNQAICNSKQEPDKFRPIKVPWREATKHLSKRWGSGQMLFQRLI